MRATRHLFSRLSVGDIFTDAECPDCGFLIYPQEDGVHPLEQEMLLRLEGRGYAVAVLSPAELGRNDPQQVAMHMTAEGIEYIKSDD